MVRDYDPVGDREQREQDAADDAVLETTADLALARAILQRRYVGTTEFEQRQRNFDRPIDQDRLRKIEARAAELEGDQ